MVDSFTPNLDLTQPEVGASTNTWGTKKNDNLTKIDAEFGLTYAGNPNGNISGFVGRKVVDTTSWRVWVCVTAGDAAGAVWVPIGDPIGVIKAYGGSSAPAGYLLCHGQAVSRTTYAALFAVIGTSYGAGNGSTTFNVPDCVARVLAGVDAGAARAAGLTTRGSVTGSATHALTAAELAAHTHGAGSLVGGSHSHDFSGTTSNNGNHFHPGSVTNTAGSHQHAITNPGTPVGVTSGSGSAAGPGVGGLTDAAGSHSHGVSVSEDGQHSHTVSGTTGATGTTVSGSTASAGSGSAHNNMQPTMAVNFIIFAGV